MYIKLKLQLGIRLCMIGFDWDVFDLTAPRALVVKQRPAGRCTSARDKVSYFNSQLARLYFTYKWANTLLLCGPGLIHRLSCVAIAQKSVTTTTLVSFICFYIWRLSAMKSWKNMHTGNKILRKRYTKTCATFWGMPGKSRELWPVAQYSANSIFCLRNTPH